MRRGSAGGRRAAAPTVERHVAELSRIFAAAPDKHAAHERARPLLGELSQDPAFVTEALRLHLEKPGALLAKNYPVVGVDVTLNAWFGLVVNCWIPLPDRRTDVSTKAIHHHGNMLLTTTTLFGPGYEHWLFGAPRAIGPSGDPAGDHAAGDAGGGDRFELKLLERAPHPQGHVAFVPEVTPHLPMYPADTTLTLALWSNRSPTTWRDHVKRVPTLVRHTGTLRDVARKVGLSRALDLKIVEYFDYYPDGNSFKGMKVREEFPLGSNQDHLRSLFSILQRTGNERLGRVIEERLHAEPALPDRRLVETLLSDLEEGRPIEGRLSAGHTDVPHANFTALQIERALARRKDS